MHVTVFYIPSHSHPSIADPLTTTASVLRTAVSTTSILSTLILPGDPSSFFTASLCDAPSYTRYMKLNYSPKLSLIFAYPGDGKITSRVFSGIQKSLRDAMSTTAGSTTTTKVYDVNHSFLVNFLPSLISLGIVLSLGFYSWLLSLFFKNQTSLASRVCTKFHESMNWNFLYGFSVYYYDVLLYCTSLELKTHHTSEASSVASLTVCVLVNIGALAMLGNAIHVVVKRRRRLIQIQHAKVTSSATVDAATKSLSKFRAIFEPFKDETLFQQAFFIFYSVRVYLHFLFLSYAYILPVSQSSFIAVLSIFSLLGLLVTRPLKSTLKMVQYCVQEALLLFLAVFAFFTAYRQKHGPYTADSKQLIGNFIIVFYMILLVFSVVMIFIQIVLGIKSLCHKNNQEETEVKPQQEAKRVSRKFSGKLPVYQDIENVDISEQTTPISTLKGRSPFDFRPESPTTSRTSTPVDDQTIANSTLR